MSKPQKSDFTSTYFYKNGQLIASYDGKISVEFFEGQNEIKDAVVEFVVDNKAYQAAVDEYHTAEQKVRTDFKEQLEREFNVFDNPKKDLLFEKAWEEGHSYGFGEVKVCYEDLVDLIR